MNNSQPPDRNRRLVLAVSGALDALIGAGILLFGFGLFPMDPFAFALPPWVPILIGAAMFVFGLVVAVHNLTRLEE